MSEDKEKDILLRINSCPKAGYHDPVARRFRRKLILRQVHTCLLSNSQEEGEGKVVYKQTIFHLVRRYTKKGREKNGRDEIWGQ